MGKFFQHNDKEYTCAAIGVLFYLSSYFISVMVEVHCRFYCVSLSGICFVLHHHLFPHSLHSSQEMFAMLLVYD